VLKVRKLSVVVVAELLDIWVVDELNGLGDIVDQVAEAVEIWEPDLCSSGLGA